jgi:predicted nucleic acid-binding protein
MSEYIITGLSKNENKCIIDNNVLNVISGSILIEYNELSARLNISEKFKVPRNAILKCINANISLENSIICRFIKSAVDSV